MTKRQKERKKQRQKDRKTKRQKDKKTKRQNEDGCWHCKGHPVTKRGIKDKKTKGPKRQKDKKTSLRSPEERMRMAVGIAKVIQ